MLIADSGLRVHTSLSALSVLEFAAIIAIISVFFQRIKPKR